ncbi:MAG: DUF2924 domain-containing protein [Sphingomicrobium sp.]
MPVQLKTGTTERLGIGELRRLWEQVHGRPPPGGLGRNLLVRALEWEAQARHSGGIPPSLRREMSRLERQLVQSGEIDLERHASLKPGTRLVREWQGRTIRVDVLSGGFEHEGRVYSSLSQLVTELTGTRWSGPRFFGLRQKSRATSVETN